MIHLIIAVTDWMGTNLPDWMNSVVFTTSFSMVIVPYLAWMPKGWTKDEPLD